MNVEWKQIFSLGSYAKGIMYIHKKGEKSIMQENVQEESQSVFSFLFSGDEVERN